MRHPLVPNSPAARVRPWPTLSLHLHATHARTFLLGTMVGEIEQTPVRVASPERTLLDLLDRPRLAGGVGHALVLVVPSLGRIDLRALVEFAVGISWLSTCQRLGVLLERRRAPETLLRVLEKRIRSSRTLLSMMPGRSRTGRVNPRWRVVENDA
jgi:predicted transcriptional regulator of viral defense system